MNEGRNRSRSDGTSHNNSNNSSSMSQNSKKQRRRDALSFLSNIPTSNSKKEPSPENRKKKLQLSVDIPIPPTSEQQQATSFSTSSSSSSSSQNLLEDTSNPPRIGKSSPLKRKSPPSSSSTHHHSHTSQSKSKPIATSKKSTALQFLQNIPLKKTPKKKPATTTKPTQLEHHNHSAETVLLPSGPSVTKLQQSKQNQNEDSDDAASSSSDESIPGPSSRYSKSSNRLIKVNHIGECFNSSSKMIYSKVPSQQKRSHSNLSKQVPETSASTIIVNRDDESVPETLIEEENDDPSIRRCHLVTKSSGMPILSCTYIQSINGKRKNGQAFAGELASVSNDAFNDINLDCNIVNGNLQSNTASQLEIGNSPQTATPQVFIKNDRKYTSYEQWFNQSPVSDQSSDESTASSTTDEEFYDPLYLDDPQIRSATSRKVMQLPGIISSTVPFIKKKELETDLNTQFRERHPNCQLSLSKIRSLKKKMLRVCFPPTPFVNAFLFSSSSVQENSFIECATVAMAVVYFEKLVLSNVVTKQNRRLVAATCLFLAFKMNYEGGGTNMEKNFISFWEALEENLPVTRKQVIKFELQVFSWLDFDLNVSINELYPHLKRLLFEQGMKVSEYIGEDAFKQYISAKIKKKEEQ